MTRADPLLVSGATYTGRGQMDDTPDSSPLSSCRPNAQLAFHAAVFVFEAATFTWQGVRGPGHGLNFGWIFNYLTLWNLLTQALYFGLAAVTDVFVKRDLFGESRRWVSDIRSASAGSMNELLDGCLADSTKALIRHRDRFFTLVFATGTVVGLGYWGLLFPGSAGKFLDNPNNTALDLAEHGVMWVVIWVELFVTLHRYGNMLLECSMAFVYGALYLAWNLICHWQNDKYAYPSVQNKATALQASLYAGMLLLFPLFVLLGRWLTWKRWGDRIQSLNRLRMNTSDFEAPGAAAAGALEVPSATMRL